MPQKHIRASHFSRITENIPLKGVGFSAFICIFALSVAAFVAYDQNTNIEKYVNMIKAQTTYCQ